ncbi:uncharacterized protein SPSK_07215 [Sporothrix schenckii 1099-18]|uniref:Uncharacterized protein n=1 Tax=Sporothrix schenckii 1099-18 TaxID=1397361 RepID=A0A0F2MHR4_SPOSC|nr:uncharacterized protein SPSK_07215 [Sporothrix schenckii 1099-18]KJR87711.1 hypothetical protein SPSK_07215 [Sporothrix schenckii 1099-18]
MASSASAATAPRPGASANEAIIRNALRYTISAREYAALHKYVLSKSKLVRRRAPTVDQVARIMNGPSSLPPSKASTPRPSQSGGPPKSPSKKEKLPELTDPDTPHAILGADDFNARAVRHALRVFMASAAGLKIYDAVQRRLFGKPRSKKEPLHKSPTVRLSLSLSAILLLYRLLFRFFTRLRTHLLDPAALPFRVRNPRTAAALTSAYAPAAGASLAGLALGIAPAPFRMTLAVMAVFRALEFAWNAAEDSGAIWGVDMVPVAVRAAVGTATSVASSGVDKLITAGTAKASGVMLVARPRARPWWWGSWMLQPIAFGQLLHAAVFDRDCFPLPYGNFIFNRTLPTDTYLHAAPADIPAAMAANWPGPYQVLDAMAAMGRAYWPAFSSPALFPTKDVSQLLALPVAASGASAAASASAAAATAAVAAVTPLTSRAHPLIKSLSCATLHPNDPSCGRTYLTYWLRAFPAYARFFLVVYTALQLPRAAAVYHAPVRAIQQLLAKSLRSATFLTGSLSTAWASICFFQAWLPRRVLPTQRFFLSGFIAGFWAWVERKHGRALFLYSARASLESVWRVGVKRRWWRPASQGADVLVFVASLVVAGAVYERQASAVREPAWRKGVSWVRGEGWRDWAIEEDDDEEEE